jgi:antitoxin component YwqK of YwqJK toxin-antitoxin module
MHQYIILVIIMVFGVAFFGSCTDETAEAPLQESNHSISKSKTSENVLLQSSTASGSLPPSRIYDSKANWFGNSAYYASFFEERMNGPSAEAQQLHVRATSLPYNGRVTRLYLSGAPEYHAEFNDGFLKGVAYWWAPDGKLVRSARGSEGDLEELDLNFVVNPIGEMIAEINAREVEPNQPVFRGSTKQFSEWNKYDSENRLTDGTTGELVSGQVKLYGDDKKLMSKTNYRDGVMHGFSNSYHSNGVQATKTIFSNGNKTGTETWWGDNGLKSYEVNFLHGKMNGLETIWGEDGSITSQLRFKVGKLAETVYTKE